MSSPYQDPPPYLSWTREEWLAHRDRAAAFLALPVSVRGKWVVGPAKVAYYTRMAEKAASDG